MTGKSFACLLVAFTAAACARHESSESLIAARRFARFSQPLNSSPQSYAVYTIDTYADSIEDSPLTAERRAVARLVRDNAQAKLAVLDARVAAGLIEESIVRERRVEGDEASLKADTVKGVVIESKPSERVTKRRKRIDANDDEISEDYTAVFYWVRSPDGKAEKRGVPVDEAARFWAPERARLVSELADAERKLSEALAPSGTAGPQGGILTNHVSATLLDPPLDPEVESEISNGPRVDGSECRECEKIAEARHAIILRGPGELSVDLTRYSEGDLRRGVTVEAGGSRFSYQSLTEVARHTLPFVAGRRYVLTLKKACPAEPRRINTTIWRAEAAGTIAIPRSFDASWVELPRPACWAADDVAESAAGLSRSEKQELERVKANAEVEADFLRRKADQLRMSR